MFFLAYKQKLHGRPLDPPMAHHVDQMDQHRQGDDRQSPEQQWMNKSGHVIYLCFSFPRGAWERVLYFRCFPNLLLKYAAKAASSGWLVRNCT